MNASDQQADIKWKPHNNADAPLTTTTTASGTKRSRITRACDICRRKKIKCDINESQQCTTCRQYGWECTFNDTTKKRGPPKGYIESLESRLRKMEALLEKIQPGEDGESTTTSTTATTAETSEPNRKKTKREISPSAELPTSIEHSKVVRYLGSSSGYYLVRDILSTEGEEVDEIKHPNLGRRHSTIMVPDNTGPLRFRKINVMDDDVMFVRDKTLAEHVDQLETDKLDLHPDIAPKSLLTKLIGKFFEVDHASLPIVDKDHFLDAYEGRTTPPPATILVYAICTHACILLPKEDPIFKDAGVDRDNLFNAFVEHTTNLVRKEYLTPRLATIQALVLLCAYPSCDKSSYRNWIRAGMAVRMAQELGLHRTLEKLPLTEEMFEARKRLWFTVYVTDRWCSAVMGRPLGIADTDCDIELPHVNGGTNGTKDYSLFINFVKLSGILGEVLRRIYSPKAKAQGYKNISAYHTVQSIYRMLNEWFNQLPDHQRITSEEARTLFTNKITTNKTTEAGPLMLCYHAVVILLYRTFLVSDKHEVYPELFDESNKHCTDAARSVIDIARLLSPSEVVRFGWNFAGYSVFQASLIHVYNCTSPNPDVAAASREYVKICINECIQPMGNEMSNAPQHALPLIRTFMDLIGAEGAKSPTTPTSGSNSSNNLNVPSQPVQQQQQHPSPMSVHAIVDWENTEPALPPPPPPQQQQQQEPFVPNNVSTAAWQQLFASAATPFFESEFDWQTTLSSLFDDSNNHTKQQSNVSI